MPSRITLKEIESLLKKGKIDGELLKDVDAVMGAITFFAPLAAGLPPGSIDLVVDVLGSRESLVKAGERIIEKLSGLGAGSEVDRYRAIESAHLLICYSAFFDAVTAEIPDFWKSLSLLKPDQAFLAEAATGPRAVANRPTAPEVQHPLIGFRAQLDGLEAFYQSLSRTLAAYLAALRIGNIKAGTKAAQLAQIQPTITEHAIERYQAQYVELAKTFPEFHIYATFHFQRQLDDRVRALADVALQTKSGIDTGFAKLATAIERIGRAPACRALADLRRIYEANVQKPILPKPVPGLSFPARRDIFIPQAYRAVRYRAGMPLDQESTWSACTVENDLGPFIERCLESPHTIDKPILILGQPGSGKSMLTHMIGAIFAGRFDTVRVELRNVPADAKLYTQIEKFVSDETLGRHISWAELRDEFTASPVVILDGLDELLQATGKVFAAYLEDCAEFQSQSLALGRPVRTIVTSRIALIGRTHIPDDTIVIRLEEFDSARQRQWAEIWNRGNAGNFGNDAQGARPFALEALHAELRKMARQPLLLLLLAIYDADGKGLAREAGLNRTALYHNIIRSFVRREEERDRTFSDLSGEDQAERVDMEMRRLAVAGLAMFNHRTREIAHGQVDRALDAFQLAYQTPAQGQPLGQAERLFGRFFFVLKADSKTSAGNATYEFLHATFGEFLAAYLIAWHVIDTCETITAQKPSARRDYVRKPDVFPDTWFECLMHAPLFNEPVILAMLNEWLPQAAGQSFDEVKAQLQAVVTGQCSMLLEGNRFPDSFKTLPALSHAAIYSANLVTIAAVANGSFVFDETAFRTYPDQTRPWDRLAHLWRSWFPIGQLVNLGEAISSRREGDKVSIVCHPALFSVVPPETAVYRIYAAASGVGDQLLMGLSGYFLADQITDGPTFLDAVEKDLARVDVSIQPFVEFRRVPIAHSLKAQEQLLAIVANERLVNTEIWARAIWMLTTEPNRFIEWADIPMAVELRSIIEPLIARTAGPADCRAFFSEHYTRPAQLIFARGSGGETRWRETYERVMKAGKEEEWTFEEMLTVLAAARHFKDAEVELRLRHGLERMIQFATGLNPLTMFANLWLKQATIWSDYWSVARMGLAALVCKSGAEARAREHGDRLLNPYWPHAASIIRSLPKRQGLGVLDEHDLNLTIDCLDLPVDVHMELLDFARDVHHKLGEDFPKRVKIPVDRLGSVSLDSYAAARRVAEWLQDPEAIKKLDGLVG